jgi:glycosyltransferase involved in cell wall biosynthesis
MEKIIVLSHWYNEELLAPLFFNHYRDCDEVRILLETDTNDGTREIASRYPNVIIHHVHCHNAMDNIEMLANINQAILEVKDGWIYMVDADEFIFPQYHENPQTFLARQTEGVVNTYYYHVYRHITEKDIDYSLPPIPQRIHALDGGPEHKNWFWKPSVFRASEKVQLTIGNHRFVGEHSVSNERYIGAHWKQADYEICIRRRLSNMARHSQHDHKRGWGNHDFHVSAEKLKAQLDKSSNLPELQYFTERR